MSLTTKEIQELFCKQIVREQFEFVCENIEFEVPEYDIMAISKAHLIHEFEVKISRSDFKKDATKDKWKHYELGINCPNYSSYVCEGDLIKPNELPNKIGLWIFNGERFECIVQARRLTSQKKVTEKLLLKMIRLHTQRKYLGGAMMTIKNKESEERFLARQLQSNLETR